MFCHLSGISDDESRPLMNELEWMEVRQKIFAEMVVADVNEMSESIPCASGGVQKHDSGECVPLSRLWASKRRLGEAREKVRDEEDPRRLRGQNTISKDCRVARPDEEVEERTAQRSKFELKVGLGLVACYSDSDWESSGGLKSRGKKKLINSLPEPGVEAELSPMDLRQGSLERVE